METVITPQSPANDYLNWLGRTIHECVLPANDRVRSAAGCLAIAQDHHHAIVVLLDHNLFASSFALLRCAFEAYIRGEWLAVCATDAEIAKFISDKERPGPKSLIERLEQTPAFAEKVLSRINTDSWNAMCAYTHTGGIHVQRWNTADAIEPNYSPAEIREVLSFAEAVGSLAVVGVASLANDQQVAEKVLSQLKARTGNIKLSAPPVHL
jgi:hypothetical protein